MADLNKSISTQRKALTRLPLDHRNRSSLLTDLAGDLTIRYKHLGRMDDLEEAISLDREALALRPAGHPERPISLNNLVAGLGTRYSQSGKLADLEECISLNREALAFCPPGHPHRSTALNNLSSALRIRHGRLGKLEDLEESISLNFDALTLCPPAHHERCLSIINLANGLHARYRRLGKIEDLNACISLNDHALSLRPLGHSNRLSSLINLANALHTRYQEQGNMEDLEASIALNRDALTLCPSSLPKYSLCLNNLANALHGRYGLLGKIQDLEECIALIREALTLCPPGHPNRSLCVPNLSNALRIQYKQSGRLEDLEESISLGREALTLSPSGNRKRAMSLNNLAIALRARYGQWGKMEDLEEFISIYRDALSLHPPGHPQRSLSLHNLACSLGARYGQLGRKEDLEEWITLTRNALAHCLPGYHGHSSTLSTLATALRTRYTQSDSEKIEDLNECISLNRDALALRPPSHPDRPSSLINLANVLRTRYGELGKIDDLEECIILNRDALTLCPPGHPNCSLCLTNLANALRIRHGELGKIKDVEEAISLDRHAASLCPPGHPGHSNSLINLAADLTIRYRTLGEKEDLQELFTCCERAASDSTSYLNHRLRATVKWIEVGRKHRHESLLNAYAMSLQLLQHSLIYRPDVETQHDFLVSAKIPTSVASDAASAAIQAGDLELAVEFLEQGRAVLWSRVYAYKSPLVQLHQVEFGGELADRLETLGASLARLVLLSDRTVISDEQISKEEPSFDARIKQHRVLCEEWEAVVGKIRAMPGFAHFLRTPPFATLRSAAAEGPVILVNISKYRSDAIVLTLESPPILVPLTNVKPHRLAEQASRLDSNRGLISVLRYLWENIVLPVVTQLIQSGIGENSRIWWCPTGELCALPLHAAGPYRLSEPNLPDLYVSSYISTLSSLIRARSNIVQPPGVPKLLVVAQSQTLKRVEDEVRIIKQYVQDVDDLFGADASHDAVLGGLKHHSWVHFACHGHLGEDDKPFSASFELYDDCRLTLLELIQARLPNAESAFLAACHSAAGDYRTPDESLHLAAALQFCGFRSVVGTLWEMYDRDAPMMSKEYYKYMFRDPEKIDFRDSAYALSSAIQAMRKAKLPPERWVMFVHIGA